MDKIVVARYSEKVDWLVPLCDEFEIYLYNKGQPFDIPFHKNLKLIQLPNVGRETDTYFHHIQTAKFEDDNSRVIFTQGDPFEHSPDFLKLLEVREKWADIQTLSCQWIADNHIPPKLLIELECNEFIDNLKIRSEFFSLKTWAPVAFFDQGAWGIGIDYKKRHYLPDGINIAAHFFQLMGLDEYAESSIDKDLGVFSYGGIFSVKTNMVNELKNRLGNRIAIMRLLASADKNYGYLFERCWLHLFGKDFIKI
jgi:hypothetical protein